MATRVITGTNPQLGAAHWARDARPHCRSRSFHPCCPPRLTGALGTAGVDDEHLDVLERLGDVGDGRALLVFQTETGEYVNI